MDAVACGSAATLVIFVLVFGLGALFVDWCLCRRCSQLDDQLGEHDN